MSTSTAEPTLSVAHQPHDWATVFSIAVVAYTVAKVVHEVIGHGFVCALTGGDLIAVSSSWCHCDKAGVGEAGRRVIEAGGTLANLAVGGVALLLVRMRAIRGPSLYAFCWLTAAVHLFMGGGYLMVDPLFGFGDWTDFLAGLEPALLWRIGLSVVGAAISLGTFFALRAPLDKLLGGSFADRRRQASLLCLLPYLGVGGVVLTGAAALNSYGLKYAFTSALATLGGTSLLLWLPLAIESGEALPDTALQVRRSVPWLVGGALTLAFLLTSFGPGVEL